ncbi:PQQ-like beta-propeller repeat protein [Pedobacter polaris]|uniref:PQQ-like beta-propeller repeat protein n=1 Tax=Pedobacter polaris TaxID=2571273 RepID=A0A4U1CN06_9SPHI|nr:PQQ-binding-like beta-propeller repeat protein [Pedobacter polaris]TKC08053.1 PQQ-like beta-propeller repeat protein [Pedobacter polaris]
MTISYRRGSDQQKIQNGSYNFIEPQKMIDLRKSNNSNPYFETLTAVKSKTVVSSSFYFENNLIIADWKGNIWCLNLNDQATVWEKNIKNPVLFEFIFYKQKLYAFNENTFFEIDIITGDITEILNFILIGSVVHQNSKIYLNERSKKGPNSTGKILEIDLNNFKVECIKEENIKSTFGIVTRTEILANEQKVCFYCDKAIYEYNVLTQTIEMIYANADIENRIQGIFNLDKFLMFIPGMKNPKAGIGNYPKNPDLYSMFIKEQFSEAKPMEETIISSTIPYKVNSIKIDDKESVAYYGGYLFFSNKVNIKIVESPDRKITGQNGFLYKNENEIYLLEPASFDGEEKEQGFKLYKIANQTIILIEEFLTNKLGKNYREPEFDFFEDQIVVRCDGQVYLLKKM